MSIEQTKHPPYLGGDVRELSYSPSFESSNDPWPKHHRVYLVLRQEILEGNYPPDQSMPNEVLLAQQFGVSRITMRKAMERLNREGLVERHRGKGTFPIAANEASPIQASISGVLENLIAMGLTTDVDVLDFGYVAATSIIAHQLQLTAGSLVQKATRIRSHHGTPFSLLTTYVPEHIGRSFSQDDLTTQPLLLLFARANVTISHAKQTITAKLATPKQANLLKMEPGDALLCISRIVFDEHQQPVEFIEGFYCPETYEHQVSLGVKTHDNQQVWDT
ncbi:GntR family transcriptional regulator [Halomonas sp. AOP5-B2-8]